MSIAAGGPPTTAPAWPRVQAQLEQLRLRLLWLTGLSGAIVMVEPSPYEIVSVLTIAVFVVTGLTVRPVLVPLLGCLFLLNLGYTVSAIPVLDRGRTAEWVAVSWYLAATCVFFAAMLGTHTEQRLASLTRGYMVAAVVASLAAIGGYFHLFGGLSDLFLRYGRAQGTFNDPNVLGAFLTTPALFAFQRTLVGRGRAAVGGAGLLVLFAAALLLTFSRGAWGQFAFSAALLMLLSLLTSRSAPERLRIVMTAGVGGVLLFALLLVLVSNSPVAELFQERASLGQSYDVGHLGRFGRHVLGFLLALDHPLGIGPLQFHRYFPEDPHNSYLNAFVSGGWVGGFSYLALIGTTLVAATRLLAVATPWRPTTLVIYAAFVGTAAESVIIDSDHWRHYLLLIGVLWGLMSATVIWRSARDRSAPAAERGAGLAPGQVGA